MQHRWPGAGSGIGARGGDAASPLLYGKGALAGLIAGMVMSAAMMLVALLRDESMWTLPNLIGAMWFEGAMSEGLGPQAMAGMLTHAATSALMGFVAVPFVAGSARGRVLIVSLAYALAAYPLAFSLVLSWANPLMFERAPMVQMTWAHMIFGIVFGVAFIWLEGARTETRRDAPTQRE